MAFDQEITWGPGGYEEGKKPFDWGSLWGTLDDVGTAESTAHQANLKGKQAYQLARDDFNRDSRRMLEEQLLKRAAADQMQRQQAAKDVYRQAYFNRPGVNLPAGTPDFGLRQSGTSGEPGSTGAGDVFNTLANMGRERLSADPNMYNVAGQGGSQFKQLQEFQQSPYEKGGIDWGKWLGYAAKAAPFVAML